MDRHHRNNQTFSFHLTLEGEGGGSGRSLVERKQGWSIMQSARSLLQLSILLLHPMRLHTLQHSYETGTLPWRLNDAQSDTVPLAPSKKAHQPATSHQKPDLFLLKQQIFIHLHSVPNPNIFCMEQQKYQRCSFTGE